MRKNLNRVVGILLIIAAVSGMIFNIAGVFVTWKYKDTVTTGATTTIQLLTTTLNTTVQGLEVATSALETVTSSISTLENTIHITAQTIENTKPLLEGLSKLMDGTLPSTIQSTQSALEGAQKGARVIDGVLRAVSSLPFISPDLYDPEVPLHEAIGNVSKSLDKLPTTFETMSKSIDQSTGNVDNIQSDITEIATNIGEINASLQEAQTVLLQYQTTAANLSARLETLGENMPTIITVLAWVVTFFFLWLALAMFGLFLQGMELIGYPLLQTDDQTPPKSPSTA